MDYSKHFKPKAATIQLCHGTDYFKSQCNCNDDYYRVIKFKGSDQFLTIISPKIKNFSFDRIHSEDVLAIND